MSVRKKSKKASHKPTKKPQKIQPRKKRRIVPRKTTQQRKRSLAAKRAWEARRLKEHLRSEAAKRGWETRRRKREEEELRKAKARPELICKVLFDSYAEEPRVEQFWANIRHVIGNSVSNILASIPATEGIVTARFRVIAWDSEEEPEELEDISEEEAEDIGKIVELQWETELDKEDFWSSYFDEARELLPRLPDGRSPAKASLLVTFLQVCYEAGKV